MVIVKLDYQSFRYDVYNIIKLFFNKEEVVLDVLNTKGVKTEKSKSSSKCIYADTNTGTNTDENAGINIDTKINTDTGTDTATDVDKDKDMDIDTDIDKNKDNIYISIDINEGIGTTKKANGFTFPLSLIIEMKAGSYESIHTRYLDESFNADINPNANIIANGYCVYDVNNDKTNSNTNTTTTSNTNSNTNVNDNTNANANVNANANTNTNTNTNTKHIDRIKKEVSRLLYNVLSEYTGKKLPWGVLTGIRPAKIAYELLEEGIKRDEIIKTLEQNYMVSNKKAVLAYNVASVEKKILDETKDNMIGLYIGIPFCKSRCLYCSFTSNCIKKQGHLVEKYMDTLKREISLSNDIIKEKGYKIQTIYIGGGTPTSIATGYLEDLLQYIENTLDLEDLEGYTLEAGRPDTIDEVKLMMIKNSRVDRISINPQSMNENTLRIIGRNHTPEEVKDAFHLARNIGFKNINMDIIVGLPGENLKMFENTLKNIKMLNPESLTVHALAIKRASRLSEEMEKFNHISDEEAIMMTDRAYECALSMGMYPYYLYRQKNIAGNLENVGYFKPGFESIYNIQMMEEKQTIIAFGAGAVTKVIYPDKNRIERAFNVKSLEEYIKRVDEMVERKRKLLDFT
jgi:coproporphyrinogen dehydrogenase HemZ